MIEMIKKEAEFYLINNYTVGETASRLHICKSTLQKHFQKLASIDPNLYSQIRLKQLEDAKKSAISGGKRGKRTRSYTPEEASRIADLFISNEYTLDELSNVTGMSRSTLYELLRSKSFSSEKQSQIEYVFQTNIGKKIEPAINYMKGIK